MAQQHPAAAAATAELKEVSKSFGSGQAEHNVLRDISIILPPRSITAIIGASGSGKSTLLRLLGGLGDGPTSGSVSIDGLEVAAYDPRCAFAFQEPRLMPWRSVAKNVELGLPRKKAGQAGSSRVQELLGLVGLSEFAGHKPREISGGMAQRTSLARALARTPQLLLLDEPFGALDALTRLRMHDLLLDIHAAEPTTVAFVTHDVDEALVLADTIIVLGVEKDIADHSIGATGRAGATILSSVTPQRKRPRDHSDPEFVQLRQGLLQSLGVTLRSEA